MQPLIFENKEAIKDSFEFTFKNYVNVDQLLEDKSSKDILSCWVRTLDGVALTWMEKLEAVHARTEHDVRTLNLGRNVTAFLLAAMFFFLQDNHEFKSLLYFAMAAVAILSTLHYQVRLKYIKLRAVNNISVLIKELSMATVLSFDYFYDNLKIRNKLKALKLKENGYDQDVRLSLRTMLKGITEEFINVTSLDKKVVYPVIENVSSYQKMLLRQRSTIPYIELNYKDIFKHPEQQFI